MNRHSVDGRHRKAIRGDCVLCVALIAVLGAGHVSAATIVALDRDRTDLATFPDGVCGAWQPNAGRNGAPALVIDARGAQSRFRLFATPRRLDAPDCCRAEAWLAFEGNGCDIDFVLLDGLGQERGRHRIVSTPREPSTPWIYGACDVALEESTEEQACAIEISIDNARVCIDELIVSTSESILPNGDFTSVDSPPDGEIESRMPRGWRRMFAPSEADSQAVAAFRVEDTGGEAVLAVTKEKGAFVLSAAPAVVPDGTAGLVARAHLDKADAAPEIALRQLGTHGLLAENPSTRLGKTLVSTGRLPVAAGADRLLLMLSFPQQAGTWRVRTVELIPFFEPEPAVRVHTDQVGYGAAAPLRFVVSSTFFPENGAGTFTIRGADGAAQSGALVSMGRAKGEHGSDWGDYYFEGVVNDVEPGVYRIEARVGELLATSQPVEVGARRHLQDTGELAYRFYSIQRCGCVVPGWHGLCHMDDGVLPDGTHVDVTGGYHNAGDMHKHMGDNTPVSVYGMACAYESAPAFFDALDNDGNGRADLLDEAVWGADWMRKMVDPETGHIWMNVTNDIDYHGIPEHDTDGIPGTRDDRVIDTRDPGDLGAFTIAAWAVLGRRLEATGHLEAAQRLWAVYEERILASYEPRQVFAAIELYRSTGESRYLAMAEQLALDLLDLQDATGWFARMPGGPPEIKIVDEGVTPAALARFALEDPEAACVGRIRDSLRAYFAWSFGLADNPFGLIRNYIGDEPFYFKARDGWFGGSNSEYLSLAWAANLAAAVFANDTDLAARLRALAADQVHWVLGMNPLDLCMFEGRGTSQRIYFHHLYAQVPGHERGAVPGAIPNGIIRPADNSDRPWFELRTGPGSPPGAESTEPWLPHNAFYLLMLATADCPPPI